MLLVHIFVPFVPLWFYFFHSPATLRANTSFLARSRHEHLSAVERFRFVAHCRLDDDPFRLARHTRRLGRASESLASTSHICKRPVRDITDVSRVTRRDPNHHRNMAASKSRFLQARG